MPPTTARKGFCGSIPNINTAAASNNNNNATTTTTTLYQILRLKANATSDEIRDAYKRCALEVHPDRPGGNAAAFKLVNAAYETLKNPQTRSDYDAELRKNKRMRLFKTPPPVESVLQGATARLCNDECYTFETAPSRLRGRFRHCDSVRWPDGRTGVIIGLAGDGNLYWREDGADYATLFQPFGDGREIEIVYRMPALPGAAGRATSTGASTTGGGMAGMYGFAPSPSSAGTPRRRTSFTAAGTGGAAAAPSSKSTTTNPTSYSVPNYARNIAAEHASRTRPADAATVQAGLSRALMRNMMEFQRDECSMRDTLRIKLYQELLSVHRRVRSMMVAAQTEIEERLFFASVNSNGSTMSNNGSFYNNSIKNAAATTPNVASPQSARGARTPPQSSGASSPAVMSRRGSFRAGGGNAATSTSTPLSPANSSFGSFRAGPKIPVRTAPRPPVVVAAAVSRSPYVTPQRAAAAAAAQAAQKEQHVDPCWASTLRDGGNTNSNSNNNSNSVPSSSRTSTKSKSPPTEPADCGSAAEQLPQPPQTPGRKNDNTSGGGVVEVEEGASASSSVSPPSRGFYSSKVAGGGEEQQQQAQQAQHQQPPPRKATTTPFSRHTPPPSVAAAAAGQRAGVALRRGHSPIVVSTAAASRSRRSQELAEAEQEAEEQAVDATVATTYSNGFSSSVDLATNRSCTPAPMLRRSAAAARVN